VEDAAGTVGLRLEEYGRGAAGLDDAAGALAALNGLFAMFARVERDEQV
jgi:hypothetical protein